jgi:hypothetical protein
MIADDETEPEDHVDGQSALLADFAVQGLLVRLAGLQSASWPEVDAMGGLELVEVPSLGARLRRRARPVLECQPDRRAWRGLLEPFCGLGHGGPTGCRLRLTGVRQRPAIRCLAALAACDQRGSASRPVEPSTIPAPAGASPLRLPAVPAHGPCHPRHQGVTTWPYHPRLVRRR